MYKFILLAMLCAGLCFNVHAQKLGRTEKFPTLEISAVEPDSNAAIADCYDRRYDSGNLKHDGSIAVRQIRLHGAGVLLVVDGIPFATVKCSDFLPLDTADLKQMQRILAGLEQLPEGAGLSAIENFLREFAEDKAADYVQKGLFKTVRTMNMSFLFERTLFMAKVNLENSKTPITYYFHDFNQKKE